jgi:hypothetical protein
MSLVARPLFCKPGPAPFGRVKILETVCKEVEDGLTARGFKIPRRPRTKK